MFEHLLHTNTVWDIFVHTYVTYENVIRPNLCYTQNMISKCICTFFFTYENV